MTPARHIEEGQLVAVTMQAVGRSFRFLPTRQVTETIWFLFGVLVGEYGLAVHDFEFMSNHLHLLCTDVKGRLPDFMRDFDSLLARALNAIRGSTGANIEGYDMVVLTDDVATLDASVYTLVNACKANLVKRTRQWKGANSLALDYGQTIVIPRPKCGLWAPSRPPKRKGKFRSRGRAAYRGRSKMPALTTFTLVRPPIMKDLSDEKLRALVREKVNERELELIEERRKTGQTVLGMNNVLRQHYQDTPHSSRVLFQNRPRVSGRDWWERLTTLNARLKFEAENAAASRAFRAGDHEVVFPHGTWLMRVRFDVRCAGPPS